MAAERQSLECGCHYEVDYERDLGKLIPCGEFHRRLAMRMRKPDARWTVTPVPDRKEAES